MDGNRLSGREQRILAEIEARLRVDQRLERRLRHFRMPWGMKLRRTQQRLLTLEFCVLIPATVILARIAAAVPRPGLISAAGACGALLFVSGFFLARRRMRTRALDRL